MDQQKQVEKEWDKGACKEHSPLWTKADSIPSLHHLLHMHMHHLTSAMKSEHRTWSTCVRSETGLSSQPSGIFSTGYIVLTAKNRREGPNTKSEASFVSSRRDNVGGQVTARFVGSRATFPFFVFLGFCMTQRRPLGMADGSSCPCSCNRKLGRR